MAASVQSDYSLMLDLYLLGRLAAFTFINYHLVYLQQRTIDSAPAIEGPISITNHKQLIHIVLCMNTYSH